MPTIYIFGKDDLLIREEAIQRLEIKNYTHRYGDDLNLMGLIELLTSSDLFAIEEAHWIEGIKGIKLTKGKDTEAFEDAINNCLPNKFVAFSQNLTDFKDYWAQRDFEQRHHVHHILKNVASQVYDLSNETYPDRVVKWAVARAKSYGLQITGGQAEVISEASANLPQLIDLELAKISILKTSDKLQPVPDKMIRDNLFEVPSERTFEYVNSLFERRHVALYLLEQLFDCGAEGPAILFSIFKRLELLMKANNEGPYDLDDYKKMPKDAKQRFVIQNRSWDRERISRAYELIAETDFRLKTSRSGQYDSLAVLSVEVMEL